MVKPTSGDSKNRPVTYPVQRCSGPKRLRLPMPDDEHLKICGPGQETCAWSTWQAVGILAFTRHERASNLRSSTTGLWNCVVCLDKFQQTICCITSPRRHCLAEFQKKQRNRFRSAKFARAQTLRDIVLPDVCCELNQ
jgi:hypothetical protein